MKSFRKRLGESRAVICYLWVEQFPGLTRLWIKCLRYIEASEGEELHTRATCSTIEPCDGSQGMKVMN